MLALLKLVSLRTWLSLAALFAIIGGFTWYTVHIENVTRAKDAAVDAKVVAAQIVHNTEVEARAKVLTDAAVAKFKSTLAASPAADAPHVLCRAAPRPRAGRADGGARPTDHAEAGLPEAGAGDNGAAAPEPERDIGPALDKLHEEADAWIEALQSYIQACIDAKICKAQQ